jgi:hypothetical protein
MRRDRMEIGHHWQSIMAIFDSSFRSSLHYAVATVNEDGSPHVTPIGALILRNDKTGFYFEEFLNNMPKNLERNNRICVLAVNSDMSFWGKSLADGTFEVPPAVRLKGTVGDRRKATDEEIGQWHERIGFTRGTKGFDLLWKNMGTVRDIHFDSFEPVSTGEMTRQLWQD